MLNPTMIYIEQIYMFSTIADKNIFTIGTKSNMSKVQAWASLKRRKIDPHKVPAVVRQLSRI